MMRSILISAAFLAVASLALRVPSMCSNDSGKVSNLLTEQRSVGLGGAKSARVNLKSANANIKVDDGSEQFLDARFSYSVAEWKPELSYGMRRGVRDLTLRQPSHQSKPNGGVTHNTWELYFNSSVPLDMSITSASGVCGLDLSKLVLGKLDATTASGCILLDIPGDHRQLSALKLQTASGDIKADMTGNYSGLTNASLTTASGNVALDLSGNWAPNTSIQIRTASGNVGLKLPGKVGVRVLATTKTGKVTAPGLTFVDGAWVNPAYGRAQVALNLKVETASGDIDLQLFGN